jgi:hypothetical protein
MTGGSGSPPGGRSVRDHVRATESDPLPAGVYRVVGVDAESVTLLALTEDGRRAHTGRIEHLDTGTAAELAPADDPDAGLGRLRQVPKAYAVRPLTSAAAALGVAAGLLAGAGVLPLQADAAEAALGAGVAVLVVLAVQAVR